MLWLEAFKQLFSLLVSTACNAELYQKLSAVTIEGSKMAEEIARLRGENLAMREIQQAREDLQFHDNVYWRIAGGNMVGPFCPKCYGDNEKKLRMSERQDDSCWRCSVCNHSERRPGTTRQTHADSGPVFY